MSGAEITRVCTNHKCKRECTKNQLKCPRCYKITKAIRGIKTEEKDLEKKIRYSK